MRLTPVLSGKFIPARSGQGYRLLHSVNVLDATLLLSPDFVGCSRLRRSKSEAFLTNEPLAKLVAKEDLSPKQVFSPMPLKNLLVNFKKMKKGWTFLMPSSLLIIL